MEDKELYFRLLEIEVEALRSVLSEYDGDKREYAQMIKADAVAVLRSHLIRPYFGNR